MVVEYVAYALLAHSSDNAQIQRLLKRYEFYILPIVNPDGMLTCLESFLRHAY